MSRGRKFWEDVCLRKSFLSVLKNINKNDSELSYKILTSTKTFQNGFRTRKQIPTFHCCQTPVVHIVAEAFVTGQPLFEVQTNANKTKSLHKSFSSEQKWTLVLIDCFRNGLLAFWRSLFMRIWKFCVFQTFLIFTSRWAKKWTRIRRNNQL